MTWITTFVGIVCIIFSLNLNESALQHEKFVQEWELNRSMGLISNPFTAVNKIWEENAAASGDKAQRDVYAVIGAGCLAYTINEFMPKEAPVKVGAVQGNEILRFSWKP